MRFVIARRCSILLAGLLLLWASQASDTRAGAPDARDQRPPAVVAPAATSFFWYSPPLYTNSTPQRISTLAFDPATAGFALAASGNSGDSLQRTTDHGVIWSPLSGPSDTRYAYRATYGRRKNTFFAWGGTQVYSSTNSGASWTQLPYNSLCNQIVTLAVHPADPKTLFVGTTNGFARSLDGGQTWLWSNPSIPDLCGGGPYAFTIGAGVDQPDVVYAGEFDNYGGGVYRSADRGATWQPVRTGLPPGSVGTVSIVQVIVDPRNAAVVYALTETGDIYKTTNGGGQWVPFETGLPADPIHALTMDDKHAYRLYGVADYDIYALDDGASTWQKLNLPPLPQTSSFPQPWRLAVDPFDATRLVISGDQGLAISLPVPSISALNRQSAPVGSDAFSLVVTGTNFTNATTVQLNGVYRLTRFISSTQVETTLYAADLATPGTITVKVGWPGAAESLSNGLPFAVTGAALQIARISPDLATAGDAGLTLTVQGREFAANAALRWNGAARSTTVVSSTQLTAQIGAADLAAPGAVAVTVANPAPDGRTSNAATFMVAPQPAPVARRLRPPAAAGPVTGMDVSPDGAYVVYLAKQDNPQAAELYTIPVAGGASRKLNGALSAGDSVGWFQISKDSKYVLYAQYSSADQTTRLYSAPLAGGAPVRLSLPMQAGETFQYFQVSDDSRRVIYLTQHGFTPPTLNRIYSVPIAGGAVTKLHEPQTNDESNSAQISPDSTRVVYTTNQGVGISLYSVSIIGGPAVKLDGPSAGSYDSSARVTSDGHTVVYLRRSQTDARPKLYKVPIGGGTPVVLFTPPPTLFNAYFNLSPNGQYALVIGSSLNSVRLDGTKPPIRLNDSTTVAAYVQWATISPDSSYVVYTGEGLGAPGATLYSVPIGGGATTQLNNLSNQPLQNAEAPQISPDSHRVFYKADLLEEPYGAGLYSVPIDGGQPAARISNSRDHGQGFNSYQMFFAPDSRSVLYRTDRNLSDLYALYRTAADGSGPAQNLSAPVPMVAGPPIFDDSDHAFEVTSDSRHVVFLGGPLRESARDLYISDLPVQQATVTPAGGTIALGDGVTLTFPPNAVTTPITVSFTTMPAPGRPLENGRIAVRGFTLEARNGAGQIITQFAQPYTLRVSYTDADLTALGVSEAGLSLGFWNGSLWVALLPCAGCSVDTANNTITVKLNHFTEFSLYGAARRSIFVPSVRR